VSEQNSHSLGDWLRQRREELGISLEQAATDTRIRIRYLEALESESFDALPDPIVGRGFLRNYAVYLGLDPKEASDRFTEKVAPPQPESLSVEGPTPFTAEPFQPVPLHRIANRRPRWLWVVGLGVVLVAALSLLGWWAYPRLSEWLAQRNSGTPTQTVASTQQTPGAEVATATRTPTFTTTATVTETTEATQVPLTLEVTATATLTPSPSPSPSPPIYTGIFLELVFTNTSWIQVTVDDVRQFQGELEAETYRSWYGEERIELRIGNAGVVLVTINGQSLGTLGADGEVVDRVFEKAGDDVTEATVTSQPTVEGTGELPASPTPRPTVVPVTPTIVPPTPPVTATPTLAPTAPSTPTVTLTPTATITPTLPVTATTSP
jgi:cytoskeletal protein RodZ